MGLQRPMQEFGDMYNEVVHHLTGAGNEVSITVEIEVQSTGFNRRIRRVVSENATQLGFAFHEFED